MDFTAKEKGSGISTREGARYILDSLPPFLELTQRKDVRRFRTPVVLTANSKPLRNWSFVALKTIPPNLMFVRILTTTWNMMNVHCAVHYYTGKKVPVVLTFPSFSPSEDIPPSHRDGYFINKENLHQITHAAWSSIMLRFRRDPLVYSCGQNTLDDTCKRCGNCLREYFAALERIK